MYSTAGAGEQRSCGVVAGSGSAVEDGAASCRSFTEVTFLLAGSGHFDGSNVFPKPMTLAGKVFFGGRGEP